MFGLHRGWRRSDERLLPVLTVEGREILPPVDVANAIGHALAKRCSTSGADPTFLRHKARSEARPLDFSTTEHLSFNKPFTMAELKCAVVGLRSVAEGPDQVHNDMIRHLPACALNTLLALFNEIWETMSLCQL